MNAQRLSLLKKKVYSLPKPLVIFIYGVPGTRKSSTAVKLAAALDFKVVVGMDQIREVVKSYIPSPLFEFSSRRCWKIIGEHIPENIVKGYLAQANLLKKATIGMLRLAESRGENMIFEGIHLCPSLYEQLRENPEIKFLCFLLSVSDEKLHRQNVNLKVKLRHGKEKEWTKDKMADIREVQKYFLQYCFTQDGLIESTTPNENVDRILEELLCKLT